MSLGPCSVLRFRAVGVGGFSIRRFNRKERLTDGDCVSLADHQFLDLPPIFAGQLDDRFVGLQFHYGLAGRNRVSFGNQNLGDVGRVDSFADMGKLKFNAHRTAIFVMRSRQARPGG